MSYDPRDASYDAGYLRSATIGQGAWNQIEMDSFGGETGDGRHERE